MKPENWNNLTMPVRAKIVNELMSSHRGELIIGQACVLGAKALRERGEESNAQDAEMIAETFGRLGMLMERSVAGEKIG